MSQYINSPKACQANLVTNYPLFPQYGELTNCMSKSRKKWALPEKLSKLLQGRRINHWTITVSYRSRDKYHVYKTRLTRKLHRSIEYTYAFTTTVQVLLLLPKYYFLYKLLEGMSGTFGLANHSLNSLTIVKTR